MPNMVDFVRNFNSDNLPHIVTKFFDEIMVLYDITGNRQDIDICTNEESKIAKFTLLMDSERDAMDLYNSLNGSRFSVYGISFLISMTISNESIETIIQRVHS